MKSGLSWVPAGERGTDATVAAVVRLAREGAAALPVRKLARALSGSTSGAVAAERFFVWIANSIRYRPDPADVDTVRAPAITLRLRYGDCDDHSALFAALCLAAGVPVRFRVVGPGRDDFQHIFPEILDRGRWVAADTTQPDRPFGWRPSGAAEKTYSIGVPMASTVNVPTSRIRSAVQSRLRSVVGPMVAQRKVTRLELEAWAQSIVSGSGGITSLTARQAAAETLRQFARSAPDVKTGLSGLAGLSDILNSIKGGIADAYNWASEYFTGEAGSRSDNAPLVALPDINVTTVPTDRQVSSAVSDMLNSPLVWVAVGLVAVKVLR